MVGMFYLGVFLWASLLKLLKASIQFGIQVVDFSPQGYRIKFSIKAVLGLFLRSDFSFCLRQWPKLLTSQWMLWKSTFILLKPKLFKHAFYLVKFQQKFCLKSKKNNSKYGFGHPNLNLEFKKLWAHEGMIIFGQITHCYNCLVLLQAQNVLGGPNILC